jgi:hypothetical protein
VNNVEQFSLHLISLQHIEIKTVPLRLKNAVQKNSGFYPYVLGDGIEVDVVDVLLFSN